MFKIKSTLPNNLTMKAIRGKGKRNICVRQKRFILRRSSETKV